MIATVRIAPFERWCDHVRLEGDPRLVGMIVWIHSETCQPEIWTGCGGREWRVEDESARKIRELLGKDWLPGFNFWMCEHQLEMD